MGDLALGTYLAGLVLLAFGGARKLVDPDGVTGALAALDLAHGRRAGRMLGAAELALAALAVVAFGAVTAALVACAYLALSVVAELLRRRADVDCGCLGAPESPTSGAHVVVDVLLAAAAGLVAIDPPASVVEAVGDSPARVLATGVLVAVTSRLLYLTMTELPRLSRAARGGSSA